MAINKKLLIIHNGMGSNSFGTIFRITTWGESHGPAIGVVIDGCPAGLELSTEDLLPDLRRRSPGKAHTSPRREDDHPEILSGLFEGKTTGAPISIIIRNQDAQSKAYTSIAKLLRPGHANFTYLSKYGIFDHRGGGRASARETACRVAAGAVAKKLLLHFGATVQAYVRQIGSIAAEDVSDLARTGESPVYCPDLHASGQMVAELERVRLEGDSLGGIVEFIAKGIPSGLGDPIYEKLEANLAKAMLSLPATKGFEIGSGFEAAALQGSSHNDLYEKKDDKIAMQTNFAGGTLGGISTGMPIVGRVAFKPASSIAKPQSTVTTEGEAAVLELPEGSRHDPCVAIRAVPVVEAMVALVLADALLLNRCARL